MRRLIMIAALVLVVAMPASADWISVYEESAYYNPFIEDHAGIITAHVVVDGFTSLSAVSFRLPIPECPGLTFIAESYPLGLPAGSIEDGVSVSFLGCATMPHLVATLTFLSTGVGECCFLECERYPQDGQFHVEAMDCNLETVDLYPAASVIAPAGSGSACGAPTVPSNPSPVNGAVDQPLNAMLDWDTSAPLGTGLGITGNLVYFGTSPDPPQHSPAWEDVLPPYAVGPLNPNTTYYWKVLAVVSDYGSTEGPVWQFTTADDIATEPSTWGRIKALYQ